MITYVDDFNQRGEADKVVQVVTDIKIGEVAEVNVMLNDKIDKFDEIE